MTQRQSSLSLKAHAPWVLAAACVVAYGLSLQGDFVWDDNVLIRDNAFAHDWKYLGKNLREDFWSISDPLISNASGFFRPVVKVAFLAQWMLFDGQPLGFRLVNLFLHIGCTLLLWKWLRARLAHVDNQVAAASGAFLGAALFALHSSRPETVSWISGSTDLWLAFWALLGLNLLSAKSLGLRLLAGPALALAVFSKEVALMLPVAFAVDALLLSETRKQRLAAFTQTLLPTAFVVGAFAMRQILVPLRYAPVGADGLSSAVTRVLATVGLYARLLVGRSSVLEGAVPTLADGSFAFPTAWVVLGAAVMGACLIAVGLSFSSERLRPYLADLAWFAILMAPVLNVVPLKYKMLGSDRFLYLPMIGLCALVARTVSQSLDPRKVRVGWGVVLLYAALAFSHSLSFVSDDQLWSHELARHPEEPYAADMLARTLWHEGEAAKALPHASTALRNTQVPDDQARLALLWAGIRGDTLQDNEEGNLVALRTFFDSWADERADVVLAVDGETKRFSPTARTRSKVAQSLSFRTQRAILHARSHDFPAAETQFASLAKDFPDRESGWVNWARILINQGKRDEAKAVLEQGKTMLTPSKDYLAVQAELNR